jgi:penicillin-binding protein 1B
MGVVWLGYDSNRPTHYTGASGALQIWSAMMKSMNIRPLQMVPPENIHWFNLKIGLWRRGCPGLESIPYIGGSKPVPLESCPE